VASDSARVESGGEEDEGHGEAADEGEARVHEVEDVEGERELYAVPEDLPHRLRVEEVYGPHVAGEAADDLAGNDPVEVAERLVDEGVVEVPAHHPEDVLGQRGPEGDVDDVEDPPHHG